MSELEAIGDAVTGGMMGRAVEPNAGEADGHTHETACLNCRTQLVGDYCHACGQQAHVHRTLGAFWHDLLHGVLHFEGKIWRTLPKLAWRPGELTRDYIDGQRARFVSPIALFLFSVFLMFAVVNVAGTPFKLDQKTPETREGIKRDAEEARADSARELAELQEQRRQLIAAKRSTAAIDREIAEMQRGMEIQEGVFRSLGADPAPVPAPAERPMVDVQVDGMPERLGWFDKAYQKAKENPQLLFYKLQSNGYKFSWALIPISVPSVWLLFLHRRRYRQYGAYDHTVFVTYSIAFMSLAWVAFVLLDKLPVPNRVLGTLLLAVPPVHMYRQLRGAYRLSRWSAAWRTFALLVSAALAASLFMLLLVLLGVLG